MRSHTFLVVAALVLGARAATLPAPAAPAALQQKLLAAAEQALQDSKPLDNVHSEQELIEQVNEVKDIDNSLRKVPHNVDAIPVKIVTEVVQPSINNVVEEQKTDLDDVELDAEPEIKRVKVDISNTGEPQRQEHDSQSPADQNSEQQTVADIKQAITDSQNVFNQGLQGVATGLQTWFTDNEQLASIQQSIQNLQVNFQTQLSKLNSTIQSFWKPEETESSSSSSSAETEAASGTSTDSKGILKNVEKGLEVIENHFEYGVKSMVNGVQVLAAVRAENASSSGTGNNPLQGISQYLESFQNNILQGISSIQSGFQQLVTQSQQNANNSSVSTGPNGIIQNIGSSIQSLVGQNNQIAAASPQSDETAEGTSTRPTIWQGLQSSFQNIWNRPGQSATQNQQTQTNQNAVGSGPIVQAIQGIPLYQGVVNLIRPTPATVCVDCDETGSTEGSNSVPAKPEEEKPQSDDQQKEKPEAAAVAPAAPAVGPLQQIVQRNPIMQGLAGAVHKIQTSIINPEKPREDDTKAGWYGGYHNGHTPAQVDNSRDRNGIEGGKSEPLKEEAPAAGPTPAAPAAPAEPPTLPQKEKECDKKKADLPVPDKTES